MALQTTRSMVSETSICNQAISWVGGNRITSMEDPSTEGEWCRDNYPFLRDAVLEERRWTFASVRKTSTSGDRDEWDQMYKHAVPLDWLSVFRVYRDVSNRECPIKSSGWKREGRFILANEETIYLWGVNRVTDTGQFTPQFAQALAARVAADMAIPFTENRQLQGDMWSLYQAKLADAAANDGMQGSNEKIQSNSMIQARARGGYGYGL